MKKIIALATFVFLLAACSSTPPLPSRPAGNPTQADFSGQWLMRGQANMPRTNDQMIRVPRSTERSSAQTRRSNRSRSKGQSVHVFLTSGRNLKVTQTDYGLFLSFDRAIVREYNFGENRAVNVGPIEAQRVSGWDGATYVVETMGEEGEVLTESWVLADEGRVLTRDITIQKGEQTSFTARQHFDRVP